MGGTPCAVAGRAPGSQSPIISTSYRKQYRACGSHYWLVRLAVLLLPLAAFSHAANCQPTRQTWSSRFRSPLPHVSALVPARLLSLITWASERCDKLRTTAGHLQFAYCRLQFIGPISAGGSASSSARAHFNINIADWLIKIELTIGNWQGANECTIQRDDVNGHSYSSMAAYIVIVGIISIARSKWANESVFICFDLSSS